MSTAGRALVLEAWARRRDRKQRQEKARKARESLVDFIEHTKPNYYADWFHLELCKIFEQFLRDVIAGTRPRVILSAPPQHGKSEIASRKFPPWAMGKHPSLRFLCASYGSTWADQLSGDRQHVMESPNYREVFPDLKLITRRAEYCENSQEGFMLAAGVDCGITGRSSDIGIIDDPVKGYKEAVSETTRESIWNWYRQDFYSRLQAGAGVIVMMTRWHEDDLIGRLLDAMKNGGEQWQVYNFPALAEQDEQHRALGGALAPHRYNLDALAAIKRVQGTYAWGALYQGHPAPAEGLMLRRDYWHYYSDGELPEFDLIVVSVDAAFKSTADSDHVSLHVWGFVGPRGYLLDRTCERMGYTATKEEAKRLARKWHVHSLLIEDKANGSAVIEELTRNMNSEASIIPIEPAGGKIARAWPFSADLEAGNAWLPADKPWAGEIVDYAAKFPTSPMDHDIDAMTQAFNWRRENMHGLFEYLKSENAKAMKEQQSRGLAKIHTSEETPLCPVCTSAAVRSLDAVGHMRCNQCGHEYVSPTAIAEDLEPTMWGRVLN